MPCGCGGAAAVPSIPSTSGDLVQTQTASATPGMPRYRVVGGNGDPDRTFDTYGAARAEKMENGGSIRAV